jgi:cell wall-associated NlpC family hydrolase
MLDHRLHLYRSDLADIALRGQVEADAFVEPAKAKVIVPVADLRSRPDTACGLDTQLLYGETVKVFERSNGWAWIKSDGDSYVGYLPEMSIGEDVTAPTHLVTAPRTFLYPEPDMKKPVRLALSMGSRLVVTGEAETRGTRYSLVEDGGAVIAAHLAPIGQAQTDDYVAIATQFLHAPYLWGGRSGFGLDCSALVQLSMMMAGRNIPRDSDMQANMPGTDLRREDLQRGDLVFWKGHVGLMEDNETLLHSNGHTMSVARENIDAAIQRIGWLYGGPTGFRRIEI